MSSLSVVSDSVASPQSNPLGDRTVLLLRLSELLLRAKRLVGRHRGGYRSGGERQQRPRPQDYYSDYREDRAPRRGDPRGGYGRDERGGDPYGDPRRRGDPRERGGGGKSRGGNAWQKEAGAAFMTYAMPMIKKEGTKMFKKEMQKFLAKQGGGGGF